LIGETGDAADARFSGRELGPVVGFARAQRGDHAHARDHHDRPSVLAARQFHPRLLHLTASTSAVPSPRQWPTAVTATRSSGPSYSRSTPEESAGGNNFSRPSASVASGTVQENCGSKPCGSTLAVEPDGTDGKVFSQHAP